MDVKRLLPGGGIVFVGLIVATLLVGGNTPGDTASGAKLVSYYDAHQTRVLLAAFLLAATAPFLIAFVASLATRWAPDDGGNPWRLMFVGGSVLAAAAFGITAFLTFGLADVPDKLSGNALQAVNVLNESTWMMFNPALGVMMLGAAGTLLSRSAGRRWLGWVALFLGIALFIPFADFVALLATGVWIIVTSVLELWSGPQVELAPSPGMA
jgi:hypothetical protein